MAISKRGLRPLGSANSGRVTMGFFSDFFKDGLHSAIKKGDTGKVRQLLADGADPNERRSQKTPLMVAANNANLDTVRLLLENGAELEAKDRQGTTALMLAAGGWGYKGSDKKEICLQVVKALLDNGADPNACGKRGQTPMRFALGVRNRRVMAELRGRGAKDCVYESASTEAPSEVESPQTH